MLGYLPDAFQVAALREALWEFITSKQPHKATAWRCRKCEKSGVITGDWNILTLRRAHRAKSRSCRFSLYQVVVSRHPMAQIYTMENSTDQSKLAAHRLTA